MAPQVTPTQGLPYGTCLVVDNFGEYIDIHELVVVASSVYVCMCVCMWLGLG